jgi:hypothetical protein
MKKRREKCKTQHKKSNNKQIIASFKPAKPAATDAAAKA